MPTFREDVKLGTKVALIKTDDIASKAVTEEKIADKAVSTNKIAGDVWENIQTSIDSVGEISAKDLQDIVGVDGRVPTEKSVGKKQQVIIGKSIRPRACEIENVENWYSFISNPNIATGRDNTLADVYVREEKGKYQKIDSEKIRDIKRQGHRYVIGGGDRYVMFRVDGYTLEGEAYTLWLTKKDAPKTLKGTSLLLEWVSGKRVYHKIFDWKNFLERYLTSSSEVLDPWYQVRRISSFHKNKKQRKRFGDKKKRKRECRWFVKRAWRKRCLKTGLFKCRCRSNGKATAWQLVYIKRDYNAERVTVRYK